MSSSDDGQWRMPFALQILPGSILLAGLFFTNESPRWLVEKGRIDEARQALSTVRSKPIDDPEVSRELEDIVTDFRGHEKLPLVKQVKLTFSDSKTLYTFTMAITLMFWQQWTGTNRYAVLFPDMLNITNSPQHQLLRPSNLQERGVIWRLCWSICHRNLRHR